MWQPHDNLFKAVISHQKVALDFFNNRLPAKIKARVDLRTLRLEPHSFVNEQLASSESDVVYSVGVDQGKGYIYAFLEQQSLEDKKQVIRLLEYNAQLLRLHCKKHPRQKKLPAIINLVFYTGKEAYKGPKTIKEAFLIA